MTRSRREVRRAVDRLRRRAGASDGDGPAVIEVWEVGDDGERIDSEPVFTWPIGGDP